MPDSSPNDISLVAIDADSWDERELDELDADYVDTLVREYITTCLGEHPDGLTVAEIVDATDISQHRVEDALEILTRERQVVVDQNDTDLLFSLDAEQCRGFGGERLEMWDGNRIFEVTAARTETGTECVKILEKRVLDDDYEHTVGGILVPRGVLDTLFSMMNVIDERFVYEAENENGL